MPIAQMMGGYGQPPQLRSQQARMAGGPASSEGKIDLEGSITFPEGAGGGSQLGMGQQQGMMGGQGSQMGMQAAQAQMAQGQAMQARPQGAQAEASQSGGGAMTMLQAALAEISKRKQKGGQGMMPVGQAKLSGGDASQLRGQGGLLGANQGFGGDRGGGQGGMAQAAQAAQAANAPGPGPDPQSAVHAAFFSDKRLKENIQPARDEDLMTHQEASVFLNILKGKQ